MGDATRHNIDLLMAHTLHVMQKVVVVNILSRTVADDVRRPFSELIPHVSLLASSRDNVATACTGYNLHLEKRRCKPDQIFITTIYIMTTIRDMHSGYVKMITTIMCDRFHDVRFCHTCI